MMLVEVLGRGGAVARRTRVEGASASIGRAYDNDVIVDDPYVDPHAARIERREDGSLRLVDLGALNGLYVSSGERVVGELSLEPGAVIRTGRTRLRVVLPDTAVRDTVRESTEGLHFLTATRAGQIVSLLGFMALWSLYSYHAEVEPFTASRLAGESIGLLLLFSLWAGLWALGTRLARGRAHFLRHLSLALAVACVLLPVETLLGVAAFLWPGWATDGLIFAAGSALAAMLLHHHLAISSRMGPGRRALTAAGVVLAIVGLGWLFTALEPEPEAPVQAALGSLLPVPESLIPSVAVEDFLLRVDDLEAELAEKIEGAAEQTK